jgi:NAD(P)H dehydrogenase (quinone)
MSEPLPDLAITGSTGALGGLVARALAADGMTQRLVVRNPATAPDLPGAVVRVAEYRDLDRAQTALEGVRTLLMVSAAESADRQGEHRTFIDAAAAAGVQHIVYTSFAGAAPDATFTLGRDHWHTEEHIRASGMRFTFLRDNFYLDFVPHLAGEDGVIRGPAGDGRAAMVARADVARSAVTVLRAPEEHAGAAYAITGGEAITLTEAAAVLSEARGTPVTFHDETIPEAYASRRRWPAPDWQYDAWVSTYTAIASGEVATVSGDVKRLTGRRPLTLGDLLTGAA